MIKSKVAVVTTGFLGLLSSSAFNVDTLIQKIVIKTNMNFVVKLVLIERMMIV